MEALKKNPELFNLPRTSVGVPVTELLANVSQVAAAWPEIVVEHPSFIDQTRAHKERSFVLSQITEVFSSSITTLESKLNAGELTEETIANLYAHLTELLEDEDYIRLALYLPFEFLPSTDWCDANTELGEQISKFRLAYMKAWYKLLEVHDVRANFTDGDVLEIEQRDRDLPRVVKAAHLIPQLLDIGMLDIAEVHTILESSRDQILTSSILEVFSVVNKLEPEPDCIAVIPGPVDNLPSVRQELEECLKNIDESIPLSITARRRAWLRDGLVSQNIHHVSLRAAQRLLEGYFVHEPLVTPVRDELDALSQRVLVEAIRTAVEELAVTDVTEAQKLFQANEEILIELWDEGENADTLSKCYRRLYRLGVIEKLVLDDIGILLPYLGGPFSENLGLMTNDIELVKNFVAAIESDAVLAELLYPVVIMYGSKLKGYGQENSDTDIGIFIKPEAAFEDRETLRQRLGEVLSSGHPIEFWLKEVGDYLEIEAHDDTTTVIADPLWTHMLFSAAWAGNITDIDTLYKKLLPPYFYENGAKIHGRSIRVLYLEALERDLLQYRLMHKGYRMHYPIAHTQPHIVDGDSVFWDSGYRLLATKLFVDMVYLPKLK